MKTDSRAGFTLIELLVVIGILAILIAAFASDIVGIGGTSDKAADQANMRWQYDQFFAYQQKYKTLPRETGSKFVLDPWVRGVCQRTEQNFARYWTPNLPDPRRDELAETARTAPDSIWRNLDEVTSEDTAYAGPGDEQKATRLLQDGTQPLLCNDNEHGPAFVDHHINLLMGNRDIKEIFVDPDLLEFNFTGDDPEAVFPVGPDSPHPLLRKMQL